MLEGAAAPAAVRAPWALEDAAAAAEPTLAVGPPLPGDPAPWSRDAAGDPALATVPWILSRAAYVDSLLAPQRALAPAQAAWLGAARRALAGPVTIQAPWSETGRFDGTADAAGYRVTLHAGERLRVELDADPAGAPLFLDLSEAGRDSAALARTGAGVLEYVADRDAVVVVRLQPPAGGSADYTITLSTVPSLLFPVPARSGAAILGHFFEPRDGGARRHQGVDISAPRGTPVLAAADGTIERVEETPLGGRVVWLREAAHDRVHYYAHLDTQLVRAGARVRAGNVIGTIGTTGNAEGTSPHLHFEVQIGGESHDPAPFLRAPAPPRAGNAPAAAAAADARPAAAAVRGADPALLRTRARTRLTGAALRPSNAPAAPAATLPRHTELEVLAASGRHFRVRTADGLEGFVAAWLVEPLPAAPATRRE